MTSRISFRLAIIITASGRQKAPASGTSTSCLSHSRARAAAKCRLSGADDCLSRMPARPATAIYKVWEQQQRHSCNHDHGASGSNGKLRTTKGVVVHVLGRHVG